MYDIHIEAVGCRFSRDTDRIGYNIEELDTNFKYFHLFPVLVLLFSFFL